METQITIFATNDIHGHFLGENDAIDFSRFATLKKNTPGCLLIDAGDATQGTPLAITEMGLYPIRIMNAVGYDILTLGNHEFDNITKDVSGVCELDNIIKSFNGVYLSQNVLTKDGRNYIKGIKRNNAGTEIRKINSKSILFIGISTPDMSMGIKRMEDFNIQSIEECASELRNIIDLIKKVDTIDAIVVIAHLGSKGSSSKLLAEKLKDIDLIIDGHSHEEYIERTEDQKTLIIQAGCYGKKFSKITLDFVDDNKLNINAELLDKSYLENNAEQDNNVLQILNDMKQEVDKKFGKVWARSASCTLWGGSLEKRKPYVIDTVNIVRFVETNLGKIVAEAMIENTIIKINENSSDGENTVEYVVGAINSSGLRESIVFDSPVCSRNLFMVLPSPLNSRNESGYSVLRILLKDLKKALEHSVSGITLKDRKLIGSDGRFLNLAGVQFELKCDSEGNISVSDDIILNRMTDYSTEPKHFNLTENKYMSILFCTTKYICQGGDGYDFADKEQVMQTDTALFNIVGQYMFRKSNGSVLNVPHVNKDITYTRFDFAKPKEVKILLVNEEMTPYVDCNVAIRFNTDSPDDCCRFLATDDKGYITVTPPKGASVLEILTLNLENKSSIHGNAYCELYFHTYYMPDDDLLTACCRPFKEIPDIQKKLIMFHHTNSRTKEVH